MNVTLVPRSFENRYKTPKRTTPAHLAGKVKILGDIASPIVDEEDWECLKW